MARVNIADLLRGGRIERVTPDIVAAWDRVLEAKVHLASSVTLATSDPTLAYVALYDAARKAITAHMQANGYRVTNRPGAHEAAGLYAEATLGTGTAVSHVRAFDRMRRVRNRSEYDQQPITERLLSTDRQHAQQIVATVETALPPRPPAP
jgi:hypothetical protein